jgi:hypothetical protein
VLTAQAMQFPVGVGCTLLAFSFSGTVSHRFAAQVIVLAVLIFRVQSLEPITVPQRPENLKAGSI